jgi:hypothetical protein
MVLSYVYIHKQYLFVIAGSNFHLFFDNINFSFSLNFML